MATHLRARAAAVGVLLALAGGSVAGCDQGEGTVRGEHLTVPDCGADGGPRVWEPFQMPLAQMAIEARAADVVLFRFGRRQRMVPPTDQLTVILEELAAMRAEIHSAGLAERPIGPGGVRVALALLETCVGSTSALIARSGTATFYELGVSGGDRVRAHLTFELEDGRSGALVGWGFEADVDFDVSLGTPTQHFVDPSSQNF